MFFNVLGFVSVVVAVVVRFVRFGYISMDIRHSRCSGDSTTHVL